jgi:class 3 adenylate cyclase
MEPEPRAARARPGGTTRASGPGQALLLGARLCGENKPGQVLVSRRVFATVKDLIEVEPIGKLSLKGFLKPVTTFNVLRFKDTLQ